ncbi:MAG: Ig-like domain-containing protein [Anaerolineae bacterium]|nr:Ig-like domain-containing protein [Gemmatimonadaceae bacterium]
MVRSVARVSAIALSVGLSAACASAPQSVASTSEAQPNGYNADTIVVQHPKFGMYAKTSLRLEAQVWKKGERAPSLAEPLHWSSSNINVAWVSESGVLTLLSPGKAILTAKSGTIRSIKNILVQPNPVARIELAPATQDAVYAGDIVRLVARVETGDGTRIPDTRLAYAVNLRGMPHTAGVMISGEGLFTAERAGDYLVIAASGGISGHTAIRVLPRPSTGQVASSSAIVVRKLEIEDVNFEGVIGTSIPLRAMVGTGGSKRPLRESEVAWTSSDTASAWVDALGVVTFRKNGRVTITAQAGNKQATKKFNVQRETAARIALTVQTTDIRTGDTVKLREEVWQKGGNPLRNARVNYAVVAHGSNSAPRMVSITDDRVFVASEPGVYTIIAELGGLAEQTTIVVRGRGLAGVSLR